MLIKSKRFLNKYPILIGIIGILILGSFSFYQYEIYNKNQIETQVKTEQYQREKNIKRIKTPAEAVYYFLKAIENEDLDQALRIFPISEISQTTKVVNLIKKNKMFYCDLSPAPTLNYRSYFPLASAEISGNYAKLYERFKASFQRLQDVNLYKIVYEELDEDESNHYLTLADDIGAVKLRKIWAYFNNGDEAYKILFIAVKYKQYWKIYDIDTEIKQISCDELEEDPYIRPENLNLKKAAETISDATKDIIDSGKGMLTANYTWSNATYGETPEALMDDFICYTQKNNIDALLTFGNAGNTERNLEQIDEEQLINRGKFAEALKYFYFSLLLGRDADEKVMIKDESTAANEVLESLNPQYFFYLELVAMKEKSDNVYYIYFKYEGDYYRFNFDFIKFNQGWQIHNIDNMKSLTYEEYEMELKE